MTIREMTLNTDKTNVRFIDMHNLRQSMISGIVEGLFDSVKITRQNSE